GVVVPVDEQRGSRELLEAELLEPFCAPDGLPLKKCPVSVGKIENGRGKGFLGFSSYLDSGRERSRPEYLFPKFCKCLNSLKVPQVAERRQIKLGCNCHSSGGVIRYSKNRG